MDRWTRPSSWPVDKLKAGETRTVEATFHGLAQWTVLSGHATLSVPGTGAVELAPISRDAMIWFLPWFIVLLACAGRRLHPLAPASASRCIGGGA